jgi:hypothetical protein
MLGLILFLCLALLSIMLLIWINAATQRNMDDICDTCVYRENLFVKSNEEFENSVCFKCDKLTSHYKFDMTACKKGE